MTLPQRRLGTAGPGAGSLGLGCMGMSQSYGVPDDDESLATVHRALDLGVGLDALRPAGARYAEGSFMARLVEH